VRWDALKCYIRGHTINFSAMRSKKLSLHQDTIEKLLKQEEQKLQLLQNSSNFSVIMNKISSYQNELDKMIENQTKRAIIRSKARWIENGEKIQSICVGGCSASGALPPNLCLPTAAGDSAPRPPRCYSPLLLQLW